MTYPAELRTTRAKGNPEETLHRALVAHLRWRAGKRLLWWHTPNGGLRSKAAAARLKGMGTLPGVPDLAFILRDGSIAFMELKAGAGKLSPEQTDFIVKCEALGVPCAVVSNLDQALEILTVWKVIK